MFRAVVVVGWWALVSLLPACATRKEFQKGYERGAADTVKRQYWILQNLQKEESAHRLTYYRFTIPPDPDAPLLRIHGLTMMGGVDITMRLPGESERGARRRQRHELREERRAQRLLDRER